MGLLNLLTHDPMGFVLIAIPLLFSIILHEVAHGWVANRMGDPTAKLMGRLTFNPLKHLDPIGTLALLFAGFGWAKPVPVNFNNIPNLRKGLIFVSSAGIAANILLAFTTQLLIRLLQGSSFAIPGSLFYYVVQINLTLAALNLIPIPPLDGSKILMGIVPGKFHYSLARLEPYGFFIIIGLLFLGILNPLIGLFRLIIWIPLSLLLP